MTKVIPRTSVRAHRKYHAQVPAGTLQVDTDVQRYYDPNLALKLERAWDDRYAGTLVVSKRANGEYFIIDGQHRKVVTVRIHGKSFLMDCEVHEGLTLADEALMFLRFNRDRKNVRPYDNYRVALRAGLPVEIRVEAEVRSRGLEVAASPSANKIAAVQTLIRLAEKDTRGGLIHDTLEVAESAWGRTNETWDGMMLQAIGAILNKNSLVVDKTRLGRTLGKFDVADWKRAAIAGAVGGGGSVSRSNRLTEVIVNRYNSKSRTAKPLVF